MSNILFNRNVYVTFGPIRQLSLVENTFILSGTLPLNIIGGWDSISVANLGWPFVGINNPQKDNRGFSGLRVSFDIKKTLGQTENDANIEIYNVSKDSYKLLQQINETYIIQLSTGYGDLIDTIFTGNIENSYYYREKSSWILNIKGKDGQELIQDSIINKLYRAGFDLKSALLDMIKTANVLPKGAYDNAKKWIENKISLGTKTQNGLTISGRLIDEINKLLSEVGASLSIQDEKAQIIYNNSNNEDNIFLISPSSGLIGSPRDKGIEEGLEFKCLLIPKLKPGSLVKIESNTINGYYRIDNIIYKGDTHENTWECNCEATKPTNIITDLPIIKYYNNIEIEKELNLSWRNLT